MPGPLQAAGAISNPTRYAALTMAGEQFTGLWTQRSPYRDAATAYLVKKFYQGSRFDSLLDGINREISVRLTDIRRPGSTLYNSNTFPPALSFSSFKSINNSGAEVIRVLLDGTDGNLYDATAGQKSTLFAKSAGAGPLRSLGVDTELFMGDGVDLKKWIFPGGWQASTNLEPGTLINIGAEPGTLQMALGGITLTVVATESTGSAINVYFNPQAIPDQFANLENALVKFSGLTVATSLNGNTYAATVISSTLGIIQVTQAQSAYAQTADTGAGTTGTGTTGGSAPAFSTTPYAVIADGGQQWKCYGPAIENWGLQAPINAPTLSPLNGTRFWQPNTSLAAGYGILDNNGDVEVSSSGVTGLNYPIWTALIQNTEAGVVSATQNANLISDDGTSGTRQFFETADPETTPPTGAYVFQNASAFALFVVVSADGGGGGFHGTAYCDSNASPVTIVGRFGRVNDGSSNPNYYPASVPFIVPPGFYYGISVTNAGGPPVGSNALDSWTEYLLNGASASTGSGGSGGSGGPSTTLDGSVTWTNYGEPGTWYANTAFAGPWNTTAPVGVILDLNGNWQYVTAGSGGLSGSTVPTWATSAGATTTDGALTWTCLGPGRILATAAVGYAFSTHAVDGSVSTASPVNTIYGGIVGPAAAEAPYIAIGGTWTVDDQIDQLWVWRTPQGQATPILEDQIPADNMAGTLTYDELGIQDTSSNGSGTLDALIAAPIADANDPPPAGLTGMMWYLGRVWGFVGNKLYYSGGPDTLVGNGSTAWPPLNVIPFIGAVVKVRPITVENGGLLVYTTSGIQIVLGTGTASNPFYDTIYCDKVNLAGYNAEDVLGTVIFLIEANAKVSSLTVQYPFNPQSGYTEVGLPIGDQFLQVTTGGITSSLYNPATSFLSWCVANTQDTGMYVADGAVGWFRMSAVSPPESGLLWSPRAAIVGGTSAVQSVETAPGVYTLLMGPPTGGGAILQRDQTGTVSSDNTTAFPSYDVKGVNLLCSTGQWTEVAHISSKSKAVGARPTVSVLLNEIAPVPTQGSIWSVLKVTGPDPVRGKISKSVFGDRFDLAQNGVETTGDALLTKFDYGTQAVADELLEWGIYASTEEERKEEAQR